MTRILLTAVALAALPLNSRAEEAAVRLTVRPMPAPKLALKYQLLPELRELNPGNAAQDYLRCFMEQRYFFFSKQAAADRALYQTMPLAELPVDKLRTYGGFALRQADWAARLDTVDWQDLRRIQDGGMERLPEELGPLQLLATALRVRFRAEVAGRYFDDAIRTAKTMFSLSRHLGEHPTEVANLVGLWVAHLSLSTLEEMVQQPGCPNLYWALTDLPCPLVDLRKGVQGGRSLVAADLRLIRDGAPMSEAELETFVSRMSGMMSFAREQAGQAPRTLRIRLDAWVKEPERVSAACRSLVEAGCAQRLINEFPPLQIILLDEKRDYEVRRDERMKLLGLPLWQIDSLAGGEAQERDGHGLFADLLPHVVKLRRTQGRLEQQIALLRHVEALRLYAAEHGGQLPETLSAISVPLPDDPFTGKPFVYAMEGTTAHVRGSTLRGETHDPEYDVHYEVTLQK
jgi:hypothetical protein